MKKLYNALFYVPKYGKVRDSVMTARAVLSLTVILLCLASVAVTAYAWFSYNISSATNRLTAARFATVAVIREEGSDVPLTAGGGGTYELVKEKTYVVEIKLSEENTAETGFCVLSGAGITDYHTCQLNQWPLDQNQKPRLTFRLKPKANMVIVIQDHWGTSSSYGDPNATNRIAEGAEVVLDVVVSVPVQNAVVTTPPATTGAISTELTYTVQDGDNLTKIASQFGVTVDALCQQNGITEPNAIYTGTELKIPKAEEEG